MDSSTINRHPDRQRKRVLKTARLVLNNGSSTIDGMVRDMNNGGVRIKLEGMAELPPSFGLIIGDYMNIAEAEIRPVRLVWQKGEDVGVQFDRERRSSSHHPAHINETIPTDASAYAQAPLAVENEPIADPEEFKRSLALKKQALKQEAKRAKAHNLEEARKNRTGPLFKS